MTWSNQLIPLGLQPVLLCLTGISTLLGATAVLAAPEPDTSTAPSSSTTSALAKPHASASDLKNPLDHIPNNASEEQSEFFMAAPENFSPGLRQSPPPEPIPAPVAPAPDPEAVPETNQDRIPFAALEGLQTDFRNNYDNFGQENRFIEETIQFRLRNRDKLKVKTGFNTFKQRDVDSISNIPLQVGWEGEIGSVKLQADSGVDLYNRLSATPLFNFRAEAPVLPRVTLFGIVEYGAYKFNARTLDNQISSWRFGPNVYWQINRRTSLFSLFRIGNYSDGNHEQQSFSRLQHQLGRFTLAANLFTWNFADDVQQEKGYFSPPDFLVYNAELAWEDDIFKFLRCRLAGTLGQQRLNQEFSLASSLQSRCTIKISPDFEADLGYILSNVRRLDTGESQFTSQSITGQIRAKF